MINLNMKREKQIDMKLSADRQRKSEERLIVAQNRENHQKLTFD